MPKDSANNFIAVNKPVVSEDSRRYVLECLDTAWLSAAGPFVGRFEEAFAQYNGMRYGIAVSNGTAALHLAFLTLGIGPGNEVIVPAFTMIAPIFAILYTGAMPIFIDCELDTFNIDTAQIEKKITPRTKAILAVHLFGHPCEMDAVRAIAKRHNLLVIEDAAEAHGALYKKQKCGSLGDLACFSFYANKIITTGEGGIVLTNNEAWAIKLRGLRDLCHSQKRFIHNGLGYNYRLTNLQAAIGLGELKNIEHYIEKKNAMADRYRAGLAGIPGLRTPITQPHVRNVFWMYTVLIEKEKFGFSKDEFREKLLKEDIDTRDFFYPPDEQPVLCDRLSLDSHYPNTTFASRHGCYLPSGLAITDNDIDRVIDVIRKLRP